MKHSSPSEEGGEDADAGSLAEALADVSALMDMTYNAATPAQRVSVCCQTVRHIVDMQLQLERLGEHEGDKAQATFEAIEFACDSPFMPDVWGMVGVN